MSRATQLRADAEAREVADAMLQRDDVMKEILDETIDAGERGEIAESGRTVCPGDSQLLPPDERFPMAVQLQMCPSDTGATWHTHVTPDQIREPINSLPDMANVVFGPIDVSVVAGTRSAHTIMAADDEGAMQDAFVDALGHDVSSGQEIAQLVLDGRIDGDAARARVLDALSPLHFHTPTGYEPLDSRISDVSTPETTPVELTEVFVFMEMDDSRNPCDQMLTVFDEAGQGISNVSSELELVDTAASTTVGIVVGELVNRALFD